MSYIKKAIRNVSFLWVGSLVGSGSTLLLYIFLARNMSTEDFGVFSSALSITNLAYIFVGFGLGQFWLKAFGREGVNAESWLLPSKRYILVSGFLAMSAYVAWALIGPHDARSKDVLIILSIAVIGRAAIEITGSKFQLEEKFTQLAIWQCVPGIARLIVIFLFFYILNVDADVYSVSLIYSLLAIPAIILSAIYLNRFMKGDFKLKGHENVKLKPILVSHDIREVCKESWPFGVAALFAFIYIQSDLIMLKYISGDDVAAFYNAAFVIITAVLLVPSVLYGKYFLPMYHRWANHDQKLLYKSYKIGNRLMAICGIFLMVVLYFSSEFLMPFIFGVEYSKSVPIIKMLSIVIPIYFVCYSAGAILVTKNHMRHKVMLMGVTALLNVVLNAVLIPVYSGVGAAIATLISNVCLLGLYIYFAQSRVFVRGYS